MKKIAVFLGIVFFIAGLLTITHYGINWDTINHLPRGQAYLNYFLTGKEDYSNLQEYFKSWQDPNQHYWQDPSSLAIKANIPLNKVPRRSLYQIDDYGFKYFVNNDGGHPPLSDILSSLFNVVLFQKLRIVNDIDSYHIYGIVLASFLVGLVFYWISKNYGKVAGFIASFSLALYPLFWSESHFNTEKDIPEAVYWSFFIYCIWLGITRKKFKWIIASGILFGLALGTKFNILFSIFVILPWLVVYIFSRKEKLVSRFNIKLLISALIAFTTGILIFVGSWPYLWSDPIGRVQNVIKFYKEIGTATGVVDPRFAGIFGINTYPVYWIVTTTVPIVLIFSTIGIFSIILNLKNDKRKLGLLFLLWLIIPIARVTWHGANIYGGIRQIMEYVPALAILSGIGAGSVVSLLKFKVNKKIFVIIVFLLLLVPILRTHPNENVYFNFLAGGLSGAKKNDIPAWGNTFGAAYRQGVIWINNHAEFGANVVYARELIPNFPRIWLRTDLNLYNGNRSGYMAQGEYVIALTYQGTIDTSYFDRYLERFLVPVYTANVDGVSVLKVWKNDLLHTKDVYKKDSVLTDYKVKNTTGNMQFDFGKVVALSRVLVTFKRNCSTLQSGYVQISSDGSTWKRLPGQMPKEDWSVPKLGNQPESNRLLIPFAADEARYVEILYSPTDSCLKYINNISVRSFQI